MVVHVWNDELREGATEQQLIEAGIIEPQGAYPLRPVSRIIAGRDEECNDCVEQVIISDFDMAIILDDADGNVKATLMNDNVSVSEALTFIDSCVDALMELKQSIREFAEYEFKNSEDEQWVYNLHTTHTEITSVIRNKANQYRVNEP